MNKRILLPILATLVCAIVLSSTMLFPNAAESIKIDAASAFLTDASGETILFEQNADDRRPIASMVKIMALNIIFDEIEADNLNLDEMISASERAASMGGSQAFLDAHSMYKAGELVRSIVVASANDSCVAFAERIAFSVEGFVDRMNDKAAELGMTNTNFVNCTGLPTVGQYSTARDVAKMFARLIRHKKFFEYASEWMYDFQHPSGRTTTLTNTNKLVRNYEGCDGGKTGYTNEAKSCLAATAVRGETRFISVVIGAADSKTRNAQVCKLFDYGFAGWEMKHLVRKDTVMAEKIKVDRAKIGEISVAPVDDHIALCKRGDKSEFNIAFNQIKTAAPIEINEIVGELVISKNGSEVARVGVKSLESALEKSISDIIHDLIIKW